MTSNSAISPLMNTIALGSEKSPNYFKIAGKVLWAFFCHPFSAVFCLLLMAIFAGWSNAHANQVCNFSASTYGGVGVLRAFTVFLGTFLILTAYKMIFPKLPLNYRIYERGFPFGSSWETWLFFGPAFLTLFYYGFALYPMEGTVVTVNGVKIEKFTLINPRRDHVVIYAKEHSIRAENTIGAIKGGKIFVQGNVYATFVTGKDETLLREDMRQKAADALEQSFKETVSVIPLENLQNNLVIEAGILNTKAAQLNLMLKPGSTITVSSINIIVPPGS